MPALRRSIRPRSGWESSKAVVRERTLVRSQAQPARNGNDSTVLCVSFLTTIINRRIVASAALFEFANNAICVVERGHLIRQRRAVLIIVLVVGPADAEKMPAHQPASPTFRNTDASFSGNAFNGGVRNAAVHPYPHGVTWPYSSNKPRPTAILQKSASRSAWCCPWKASSAGRCDAPATVAQPSRRSHSVVN